MFKNLKSYSKLFWQLLKTDLLIYKQNIFGQIIDEIIWITFTTIIASYVYPQFGMSKNFGTFFLVGTIVSSGVFNIFGASTKFLGNIEGSNPLSYFLTLPIPSWLHFIKLAIGQGCIATAKTIIILPLGKIILWNRITFANLSIYKFILIYFAINFSMGMLIVFMTSLVKNLKSIHSIWSRFLFPLWFLGGAMFTWKAIHNVSPKLAIILLLNPLLHLMEGVRAAVLGQEGYINFWICFLVAWFFAVFLGWVGICRFKKRLDFV